MYKHLLPAALFAASVAAHGHVLTPTPRGPGKSNGAFATACGQQVWNMMNSDINGNIQTMAQIGKSQSDFKAAACELPLCKGMKYADNTASLQTYSAGDVVDFTVQVAAPHTGIANVSVVDTTTNTMVGNTLISWDVYASVATGVAKNNTAFSVTIPVGLPSTCSTAGNCVLQWWWDARSIDQTYMSCVDFVIGDGSSSGSSSSAKSAGSQSGSAAKGAGAKTTPSSSTSSLAQATTLKTVVVSTSSSSASKASATGSANSGSGSDSDEDCT